MAKRNKKNKRKREGAFVELVMSGSFPTAETYKTHVTIEYYDFEKLNRSGKKKHARK